MVNETPATAISLAASGTASAAAALLRAGRRPWLAALVDAHLAVFRARHDDEAWRRAQAALDVARLGTPRSGSQMVAWVDALFDATAAAGEAIHSGHSDPVENALSNAIEQLNEQLRRRDRGVMIATLIGLVVTMGGVTVATWELWRGTDRVWVTTPAVGMSIIGLVAAVASPRLFARGVIDLRFGLAGALSGSLALIAGLVGLLAPALGSRTVGPTITWGSAALLTAAIGALIVTFIPTEGLPVPRLAKRQRALGPAGEVVRRGQPQPFQAELARLRDVVASQGEARRTSARRWRLAYIAIGLPSAALAGAAGVTGAAGAETGWTVGLALGAAALTALSGALNPGKQWEATGASADRCESLVREIDVMRHLDVQTFADETRDAIETILVRLDQALGVAEQPSFWSQWRTRQPSRS